MGYNPKRMWPGLRDYIQYGLFRNFISFQKKCQNCPVHSKQYTVKTFEAVPNLPSKVPVKLRWPFKKSPNKHE